MDSPADPGDLAWSGEQISTACQGELHPLALKGVRYFNAQQYFEAHEELEIAWREERGPVRDVYRGILQVGLGYYHIQRMNYRGAVKMFQRCRHWLDPFPARCRGIDVAQLRLDMLSAEKELLRLGPDRLAQFNPVLMKPVIYHDQDNPDDGFQK